MAKIPTLEFGSTWRASVESRFRKARARCWETCFLRLANMTSRHWSTIPISSLVRPQKQNFIERVKNQFEKHTGTDCTLCYWLHMRTWETAWKQRGSYTALMQNQHKHPSWSGKNSPALKRKKVSLFLCFFLRKYLFHQKCLNIRGNWCFNPKCIHYIIFYKLFKSAKI